MAKAHKLKLIKSLEAIDANRALKHLPFSFRVFNFFPLTFDKLLAAYCSDNNTDQLRVCDPAWLNGCRQKWSRSVISQCTHISLHGLDAPKPEHWKLWPGSRPETRAVFYSGPSFKTMSDSASLTRMYLTVQELLGDLYALSSDTLYKIAFNYFDGVCSDVVSSVLLENSERDKARRRLDFLAQFTQPRPRLITQR